MTSPRVKLRFLPHAAIATDTPLDPAFARDAVANNLIHLADQACAKVLVNDMAVDDTLITGGGNAPEVLTITNATDEWRTVAVYGPFDISTYLLDGQRYGYRLRAMILATDLNVSWAAQLCLPDTTAAILGGTGSIVGPNDACNFDPQSSATPVWLDALTLIEPSQPLLDASVSTVATIDSPSGLATAVYTSALCLRVLCKGSGTAELYGCHLAEYFDQ